MGPMETNRILIVRTGGLGDSLMLWPAVYALRKRFPSAHMELMGVKKRLEPMVGPGGADAATDIDGSGFHSLLLPDSEIPRDARKRFGSFDVVIAFSSKGDVALGENLYACGVDEVHVFLPFPTPGSGVHVARHTLDLFASVGMVESSILGDAIQGLLPLTDKDIQGGRDLLAEVGVELDVAAPGVVIMAPGSGSEKKNWFVDGFAQVARDLSQSHRVVLIEGPADVEAIEQLTQSVPSLPVLRSQSPSELKGVLAQCQLFLGNDSGISHLAGLVGAPSVVVFKASDPDLWRPLGQVEIIAPSGHGLDAGFDVEAEQVLRTCHHLLDYGAI